MRRFYQSVDLRSRSQMTDFLTKHFRYPTMNSWNNAVSYACNLKIHSLGLCDEVYEKLYVLLECQEFFLALKELMDAFAACGQLNYRSIKETGKQCGKCGLHTRVDFDKPHMQVSTFPGRGTDDDTDFTDWSMDELKDRVRLIQDFDRLADRIVDRAIDIAKHYSIEEEEYYVPKVRKVLVPAGA